MLFHWHLAEGHGVFSCPLVYSDPNPVQAFSCDFTLSGRVVDTRPRGYCACGASESSWWLVCDDAGSECSGGEQVKIDDKGGGKSGGGSSCRRMFPTDDDLFEENRMCDHLIRLYSQYLRASVCEPKCQNSPIKGTWKKVLTCSSWALAGPPCGATAHEYVNRCSNGEYRVKCVQWGWYLCYFYE